MIETISGIEHAKTDESDGYVQGAQIPEESETREQ